MCPLDLPKCPIRGTDIAREVGPRTNYPLLLTTRIHTRIHTGIHLLQHGRYSTVLYLFTVYYCGHRLNLMTKNTSIFTTNHPHSDGLTNEDIPFPSPLSHLCSRAWGSVVDCFSLNDLEKDRQHHARDYFPLRHGDGCGAPVIISSPSPSASPSTAGSSRPGPPGPRPGASAPTASGWDRRPPGPRTGAAR